MAQMAVPARWQEGGWRALASDGDSLLYVVKEGRGDIETWDDSSGKWAPIPSMGLDQGHKLVRAHCAVVGGKLYVVGTIDKNGKLSWGAKVYDPSSRTWMDQTNMKYLLLGATEAVSVWDELLVFGRFNDGVQHGAQAFHPEDENWKTIPSLHVTQTNFAVAAVGERLFLVGGQKQEHTKYCGCL